MNNIRATAADFVAFEKGILEGITIENELKSGHFEDFEINIRL